MSKATITYTRRKTLMKKREIDNRIIIIGGDHHNTLAVVRDLGSHNCDISVLLHGDFDASGKPKISYSRYAKKCTYTVENDEQAILEWLITHHGSAELKTILFPCSDLAAYTIDDHNHELSKWYIIPGFKNSPGRVVQLMDKMNQKRFADENGIPMAKSQIVSFKNYTQDLSNELIYPIIIKPNVSAFGNKSDIKICRNCEELERAIQEYCNAGYKNAIFQEFLKKKYEVCAYGCLISER